MENEELKKTTWGEILLVEEVSKGKIFLVKAVAKSAVFTILSPFLCDSQVVFFLQLHFFYLNSENKQNVGIICLTKQ